MEFTTFSTQLEAATETATVVNFISKTTGNLIGRIFERPEFSSSSEKLSRFITNLTETSLKSITDTESDKLDNRHGKKVRTLSPTITSTVGIEQAAAVEADEFNLLHADPQRNLRTSHEDDWREAVSIIRVEANRWEASVGTSYRL